MPTPRTLLQEGIAHLEDLPVQRFIKTVETLKDKIITEKLDGSNLWFGFDPKGFFTSREGKSSKTARFYNVSDYAPVAAYNGFRAAHLALESVKAEILQELKEEDLIEVEIMFGRQPNTVTYGVDDKNFIVMLRPVNGDADERFEKLSRKLNKKTVNVTSTVISSNDGESLQTQDVGMEWQFVEVAPINLKRLDLKQVERMLSSLKAFLSDKNAKLRNKTNGDVSDINLGTIGKADRESVKVERQRINDHILSKFKKPIKDLLLSTLVHKIKPALQAKDLHPDEDLGVEGVVIRDPESGDQTKLVDKDTFTAINAFNSSVRNSISGPIRTADQDAPIDDRGGILGQSKIRIATLLGAKELAVNSTAKRFIQKLKADSVESTAKELADSLNIGSLQSVKTKILAILDSTDDDIEAELQKFKSSVSDIKLDLKSGKQIGMSPEVVGRTLTSFAETKADVAKLKKAVLASSTTEELVQALYGRTLQSLFKEDTMKFNLLRKVNEDGESGEAAPAAPAEAQMATASSSFAIAPSEKRIFKGSKPIMRKIRKFKKAAKFSSDGNFSNKVKEDTSSFDKIEFAKDVDDNTTAVKDPEFKTLRNNITVNNANSQTAISDYLQKAHEINDEVDSVAFGMENDDGSIIKVWVNAEHADDFEKSLAELLGKEDDAEKVINDLADDYDIIDVEWPKVDEPESADMEPENDDALEFSDDLEGGESDIDQDDAGKPDDTGAEDDTADNEELSSAEDASDAEKSDEDAPEIFLGTKSDEDENEEPPESTDEVEGEDAADGQAEDSQDDELDDEDDDGLDDEDEDGDELDDEDGDELEDGDGDELEDDDELDDDDDELIDPEQKPKKKKQDKENTVESYGEKFKQKLLTEAKKKKEDAQASKPATKNTKAVSKLDSKSKELASSFPAASDQAVISLVLSLGAPASALELHKTELRDGIVRASKLYRKNSTFKMWVTKLTNALDAFSGSVTEQTNFGKQLSGKYQKEVFDVMIALGLPESVTATAARTLKAGIKSSASVVSDDSEIRLFFSSVAEQLGVSTSGPKAKVTEAISEDGVGEIIMRLLQAIGIEVEQNSSVFHQMNKPDVRRSLLKLSSSGILKSRLGAIVHSIEEKTIISPSKRTNSEI